MSDPQMTVIYLNEYELGAIELIRVALSEPSQELRLRGILNAKHDVSATRIEQLAGVFGDEWASHPANASFVQWVAKTSAQRHEAAIELMQLGQRYERRNERKLNVAEQIGELIWRSIASGEFRGVQTDTGILTQVREIAKDAHVSGGRDKDTLREIWNDYRGVVHLGMAITDCENNPELNMNVLHLAEFYRRALSENCPKSQTEPYVDPAAQISFIYLSRCWGPRFADRGLSYQVD